MADTVEERCRLASEFGRVYETRKCQVNVGKSEDMWCYRYMNAGVM